MCLHVCIRFEKERLALIGIYRNVRMFHVWMRVGAQVTCMNYSPYWLRWHACDPATCGILHTCWHACVITHSETCWSASLHNNPGHRLECLVTCPCRTCSSRNLNACTRGTCTCRTCSSRNLNACTRGTCTCTCAIKTAARFSLRVCTNHPKYC